MSAHLIVNRAPRELSERAWWRKHLAQLIHQSSLPRTSDAVRAKVTIRLPQGRNDWFLAGDAMTDLLGGVLCSALTVGGYVPQEDRFRLDPIRLQRQPGDPQVRVELVTA